MTKKHIYILTIFTMVCSLLVGFLIGNRDVFNQPSTQTYTSIDKRTYIEKGKYIGRSAFLVYLAESDQVDSLTIELERLFFIEDSLEIIQENK